jgi:hypothetical protein
MCIRDSNREIHVSALTAESASSALAYGTVEAVDSQFRVSSEPFNLTSDLAPDTDLVGGLEEATAQDELARSVQGNLTWPRMPTAALEFIAAYGLGGAAKAASGTGYKHTFTNTTAYEIPSFTLEEILLNGTLNYRYPGCLVDSFTLSCSKKQWWQLDASVIASGTRTSVSAPAASVSADVPLKGGDATIYMGTAYDGTDTQGANDVTGDVTGFNALVTDLSWTYNNNISADDLYDFGGGKVRTVGERDRRSQELSFSIELQAVAHLDYLTGQDTLALEIDCDSGIAAGTTTNEGFAVIFPEFKYRVANVSGGTGKLMVDIEATVIQDATYGSIQVVTYSDQATTYLTLN